VSAGMENENGAGVAPAPLGAYSTSLPVTEYDDASPGMSGKPATVLLTVIGSNDGDGEGVPKSPVSTLENTLWATAWPFALGFCTCACAAMNAAPSAEI